ncbi:MAG: chain length determinant protein EpsF [Betaproteobacteria bacterium]|nr:chain length determinant protein EpsF [Betaproteobacteria bacterium]
MNFSQFLLILKARRRFALMVFSLVILTTLVVSLVLPKQYSATVSVVVDVKSPDPVAGIFLPAMAQPAYMATQVDIIKSQAVALRVVKGLKLDESPLVREQWQEDTEGKGSISVWLADLLQKYLDVKPSRESNVIGLTYTSKEPQFAAVIANAFARAYIDANVGLRVDPAKEYAASFDQRIKVLRDQLEAAQAKLTAYQREKGIISADERLDVENARLQQLTIDLVAVQGFAAESRARSGQAHANSEIMPEVLQNPLIQNLKAELARLEAKRQEQQARYGPNHPESIRTAAELDALRARVQSESARVSGGVGTTNRVNVQREAEVRAALEKQRARVLEIKHQRDELVGLQQERDNAQKAYDGVAQRLAQASLESQVSQTNISVLTPAVEPVEHSRPKLLLNMALAVFLGSMLAVGSGLAMEILDRRPRSAEDLAAVLHAPVLGLLSAGPRLPPRLFRRKALSGPPERSGPAGPQPSFGAHEFSHGPQIIPAGNVPYHDRMIGTILRENGKLSAQDEEQILTLQREKGLRFGDAALHLGMVTERDLTQALSQQFGFSYMEDEDSRISEEVALANKPFGHAAEQIRALRSEMVMRWRNGQTQRKVVAVVSPRRGEGRSVLAANLAVAFAQMGENTLVIDADMRNPSQHRLFGVSNQLGLSTLLSGRRDAKVLQPVPGLRNLCVLPVGAIPPNPQELLARQAFGNAIQLLHQVFDVIILDTPAFEEGADAQIITGWCGAALVLARQDQTPLPAVEELAHKVNNAGAEVMGGVLASY